MTICNDDVIATSLKNVAIARETPEFIPRILWPQNSPDLNPVDYSVWGTLQGRCTKEA